MPIINLIDCKTEKATTAYPYAICMTTESTTASNISIFEDFNINQLGCDKNDLYFEQYLTF